MCTAGRFPQTAPSPHAGWLKPPWVFRFDPPLCSAILELDEAQEVAVCRQLERLAELRADSGVAIPNEVAGGGGGNGPGGGGAAPDYLARGEPGGRCVDEAATLLNNHCSHTSE